MIRSSRLYCPSEIAFERYYSQPMPGGSRDNNTLKIFSGTSEGQALECLGFGEVRHGYACRF
jgi:hypothetical protein